LDDGLGIQINKRKHLVYARRQTKDGTQYLNALMKVLFTFQYLTMAYSEIYFESAQENMGIIEGLTDKKKGLPRPEEADLIHTDPKKKAYYRGYNQSYPPAVPPPPPPPVVEAPPPPPPVAEMPRPRSNAGASKRPR
jgi:hypothetical protein